MSSVAALVRGRLGEPAAARMLGVIEADPAIGSGDAAGTVSRGAFAAALGICLFHDLLAIVPSGEAYVRDREAAGERVRFDHGALRTIRFADGPTGALPPGQEAFRRILEPLGYRLAGTYPLPRLHMVGRAYAHADHPETIPQYFVSELLVEQFAAPFAAAAERVFGTSRDPIGASGQALLRAMAEHEAAPFAVAAEALPELLAAFGRQHAVPTLADYEVLRAQSAEAAWIATEGNSFNHATDRVADVEALAAAERALGRPIKDTVEVSASGRVRQTAYRADPVLRQFRTEDGEVERQVPGSFYEFITRDIDPETGRIDLAFDSANATGIFGMTKAA